MKIIVIALLGLGLLSCQVPRQTAQITKRSENEDYPKIDPITGDWLVRIPKAGSSRSDPTFDYYVLRRGEILGKMCFENDIAFRDLREYNDFDRASRKLRRCYPLIIPTLDAQQEPSQPLTGP
jgi:hypothetical protein